MGFDVRRFLARLFAPDPPLCPEDLPMDRRIEWEERAAILEFDAHLPRERAEREALKETIERMRQEREDLREAGRNRR